MSEALCRRVRVQRAALGHSLDDIVVSAQDRSHGGLTLSLQVKQSLTISAAPSNTDFREVIVLAHRTVTGEAFIEKRDRVGAAVAHIASDKLRAVRSVCEMARLSADAPDFAARLALPGLSCDHQRGFVAAVRDILSTELGRAPSHDELCHLFRHFVLMQYDLRTEGAEDDHAAVERLRVALRPEAAHRAIDLWRALLDLARRMAGTAGSMDRAALLAKLSGEFEMQVARRYAGDLVRIADAATHALQDIGLTIDGIAVERPALVEKLEDALQSSRYVEIQGAPGSGKSALLRHYAERSATRGFVLVLKSDRIVGPGWAGLALHWRLETDRLHDLLVELAATRSDRRAAAMTMRTELLARAKRVLSDTSALVDLPTMPPAWVLAPPRRRWRGESVEPHWREPDTYLRWDFAPIALNALPLDFAFSKEAYREPILHLVDDLVKWTFDRFSPAWATARDRDRVDAPHEWGSASPYATSGFTMTPKPRVRETGSSSTRPPAASA